MFDHPLFAVVPVLVGPLQVLLAVLPYILFSLLTLLVSLFKPRVMKQILLAVWRVKLHVIVVLAIGWGGIRAARVLWPKAQAGQFESGESDWPMFRGGLLRRGSTPHTPSPTRGGIQWTYKKGDEGFFASPAVLGNRVYVASAEIGAFRQTGTIYCFDADSGRVVWSSAPDGYRATFSSPAVSGRYLVCGEGLHVTNNARVVCLDLEDAGRVLWTHETKSHVECTPVIDGSRVYVGAGDDGYYCFELEPQSAGQAKVVWQLPGKDYPDAETSLAVHDGKVYAGLGLGGRALCVLDADTGRELRRIPTPYPVFGPPAISQGRLYVSLGNGDYVHTAEEAAELQLARMKEQGRPDDEIAAAKATLGPAGEVWCLDLESLEPVWKRPVGQTILGAVAVADDGLYVATRAGEVLQLGLDGQILGRFEARSPIVASPAVTDDVVYVVTNSGRLFGLDRHSLEPVWEFPLSSQPLCVSSPTVARGHVYVGTQHDGFLCVGTREEPKPLWAGFLGGPGRGGNVDASPWPPFPQPTWQIAGETTLPVAVAADVVIVGQNEPARVAAFSAAAEGPNPSPLWERKLADPLIDSPAIIGDLAIFVSGRELHAVGLTDGQARWQASLDSGASGLLTATPHELFVQVESESLTQFALTGKTGWTTRVGLLARPPVVTEAVVLAAVRDPDAVVLLDRETGRELWRAPLPAAAVSSPVVAKNRFFVGTEAGLFGGSMLDGERLDNWRDEAPAATGELVFKREVIGYIGKPGDLVLVSPEDGRVLAKVADAQTGLTPVYSRGQWVFAGAEGLLKAQGNPRGEGEAAELAELLFDASETGPVLSPVVLSNASIYFGTAKGFFRIGE